MNCRHCGAQIPERPYASRRVFCTASCRITYHNARRLAAVRLMDTLERQFKSA